LEWLAGPLVDDFDDLRFIVYRRYSLADKDNTNKPSTGLKGGVERSRVRTEEVVGKNRGSSAATQSGNRSDKSRSAAGRPYQPHSTFESESLRDSVKFH